jgi:hypothetical protein
MVTLTTSPATSTASWWAGRWTGQLLDVTGWSAEEVLGARC